MAEEVAEDQVLNLRCDDIFVSSVADRDVIGDESRE